MSLSPLLHLKVCGAQLSRIHKPMSTEIRLNPKKIENQMPNAYFSGRRAGQRHQSNGTIQMSPDLAALLQALLGGASI